MSDPVPILEYAGPRNDIPPDVRIQCVRLQDGGVRFVDPAIGWGMVRGNVVAAFAAMGFVIVLPIMTVAAWGDLSIGQLLVRASILVATVCLSIGLWIEAKLRATCPLIIEASGGELRVDRPQLLSRSHRWRVDQLRDVRAAVALPYLKLGQSVRMVSALVIVSRSWLGLRLLEHRPADEIAWIVRELRAALELPDRSK